MNDFIKKNLESFLSVATERANKIIEYSGGSVDLDLLREIPSLAHDIDVLEIGVDAKSATIVFINENTKPEEAKKILADEILDACESDEDFAEYLEQYMKDCEFRYPQNNLYISLREEIERLERQIEEVESQILDGTVEVGGEIWAIRRYKEGDYNPLCAWNAERRVKIKVGFLTALEDIREKYYLGTLLHEYLRAAMIPALERAAEGNTGEVAVEIYCGLGNMGVLECGVSHGSTPGFSEDHICIVFLPQGFDASEGCDEDDITAEEFAEDNWEQYHENALHSILEECRKNKEYAENLAAALARWDGKIEIV